MADIHYALKQESARYCLTNLSEAHLAQLSKAKDTAHKSVSLERKFTLNSPFDSLIVLFLFNLVLAKFDGK